MKNSRADPNAPPPSGTSVIRVLLVDDHPSMRDVLRQAIQRQPDMQIAGEAGTWREALDLTCQVRPDVLLLDLSLPDGNGWHLLEQLRTRQALPPTLVFSGCAEDVFGQRLLRAGARGYLMKSEPLTRVLTAIREVHAGHLVASAALTSTLMSRALELAGPEPPKDAVPGVGQLSDRELQIFVLLGQGFRSKEAADRLNLSEKTVATYKARVMEKLGVKNTAELVQRFQAWQPAAPAGQSAAPRPTGPDISLPL